jgi:hypothetical protein
MWACVIVGWSGKRLYSSFYGHDRWSDAILYAEQHPGVVAVEKAHAGEPPIWTREEGVTQHGKETLGEQAAQGMVDR